MMRYTKEYLVHAYSWPANTTTHFSGEPSRRWFDRDNGSQLLFIINCFYESVGLTSPEVGIRVEQLIKTQLPIEKMSEITVFKWLSGAYLYHGDR